MSLSTVAEVLKAPLIGEDAVFAGVSTDTRSLQAQELFVALKGENYDGHNFLAAATGAGAVGAIVSRSVTTTLPHIMTEDTRLALGDLAAFWRQQFTVPVIAVTGSNGKTTVKEIMVPRVDIVGIEIKTPLKEVIEIIRKSGHSRLPLYRNSPDEIEGIVYAKDLLTYALKGENIDLSKIVRKSFFIPENIKIDDLLTQMRKRKLHIAIVVDEYGGTSGLVTMEDLMEEIVGEIQDEYDKDKPQFIEQGPFDYIVLGDAEVEELEDLFDMELASDDYITVGGLITHHLGRFPLNGEKLEIKGLELVILEADQKTIKKLRIRKK